MDTDQSGIILTTSIAAFVGGFVFGVWTIRGYLIPPSLKEERRRNLSDPVESDESDIGEDDGPMDHAPSWVNGLQADRSQGLSASSLPKQQKTSALANSNEECKLVLVVRTDLGMTKGKIAAQCSHATLACYKAISRAAAGSPERAILSRWEKYGQAKIALQAKSEDEILELRRRARNAGITAEFIQDAGRTQIEAGSMTALGVGPAPKSAVDQITGHLKLL